MRLCKDTVFHSQVLLKKRDLKRNVRRRDIIQYKAEGEWNAKNNEI